MTTIFYHTIHATLLDKCFDPVESQGTEETLLMLKHARGNDEWKLLYSDGWPAFKETAKIMGIPHEMSTPGISQTNAVIERCIQDCQQGIRAMLMEAGLPACFWVLAGPCYCMLENIKEPTEEISKNIYILIKQ